LDLALFASALLLGLAGVPHCAAMCAPTCGALLRGCGAAARPAVPLGFHLARIGGYAAAGAVAASSVGALAQWSQTAPVLRPLWTLLHAAALGLGLWLLWTGRQPAWLENLGRGTARAAPQAAQAGWQRLNGPARAAAAGGLWVAWPCGLLQSALLVAALANSAWGGAAVMAGFATVSAAGLTLAPWAFGRLVGGTGATVTLAAGRAALWATRFGGAVLAAASAWALGQDLIRRAVAYCFG
jgi:hypothetical protein